MLVAIHQPNYLPWSGFFHKWMSADVLVLLDTVQYHKQEWQNRNRIKTAQGPRWLTVPVHYRFGQSIREVKIADRPWARKHIMSIEQAYAGALHLNDFWPPVKRQLECSWQKLSDLNTAVIRCLGELLGIKVPVVMASQFDVHETDPTGRLIALCRRLGADAYLSGQAGKNYLTREHFAAAGLDLVFQQVQPPVYPQLHGEFVPALSSLDMLLNIGPQSANIIRTMGDLTR